MTETKNCHDCGVEPGQVHVHGCDVERCPVCGYQLIGCACIYQICGMDYESLEQDHPDIYNNGATEEMEAKFDAHVAELGGYLPWTGTWPGSEEAAALGWFSKWVEGAGWVRCRADDPGAGPDLNRFYSSTTWDPKERRYKT